MKVRITEAHCYLTMLKDEGLDNLATMRKPNHCFIKQLSSWKRLDILQNYNSLRSARLLFTLLISQPVRINKSLLNGGEMEGAVA